MSIVCHLTLEKKRQTKNKKEKLFFGSFDPIRTYDTAFCVNLFFFEKFMKNKKKLPKKRQIIYTVKSIK